ncbi:MAG: alanine--tRNA ligase [Anaerolineae bacterium]|nr:alanine--tRNA ligase [Anaerolineae bacterium]
MKKMTSAEIRQAFLDFFAEMGHKVVASSSLVPGNDPTLLFTNAGMVQFKDVFLGLEKRDYKRAATAQKCMRVSGKHNDLEEVGPSPRHHTFFEMLGNFSFGDYFKRNAIRFAYDCLTQVYGLDPDRFYYTVHYSDDEAYDLWISEVGADPGRIARLGDKSNFWQMADVGPCGPNSEIHYDLRPEEGPAEFDEDSDRWIELWNLVFMQFNQDETGKRTLLPRPGVDTGMGFERLVTLLQGAASNYDTDIFMPIIERTQALAGQTDAERKANYVPYRVIADHTRAAAFLIADGVTPGNTGRNYVTRMVLRRAARFGRKLGFTAPFMAEVADAVIEHMGAHYTELVEKRDAVRAAITQEEERFGRTLDRGLAELGGMLDQLEAEGQTTLAGEQAFFLYSTLGLPLELTQDVAAERSLSVDQAGFRQATEAHAVASGAGKAMGEIDQAGFYNELLDDLKAQGLLSDEGVRHDPYGPLAFESTVLALVRDGQRVDSVITGERVEVVLPETHFYVEAGGQVSDAGTLCGTGGAQWGIDVEEMRRPVGGLVVHVGEVVEGTPRAGDKVRAAVDAGRRWDIMRNHTATHLLHSQLRAVLGKHVQQAGSLVAPDRLRFDFSHGRPVTAGELERIQMAVNEAILADMPVMPIVKELETARTEGAMALFGEKYGEQVRTITVGDPGDRYSYELCGGTHVERTSLIGPFIITNEESVAAGVRRIEAVTGRGALALMNRRFRLLQSAADLLGVAPGEVQRRLQSLQDEVKNNKRLLAQLRQRLAHGEFAALMAAKTQQIGGAAVLAAQVDDADMDTLRQMADWFRDKNKTGVMVLGTVVEGKPQIVAAVTDDLAKRGVRAGDIVKQVAQMVGGGGGGRPTLATAGGHDPDKLPGALAQAPKLVADALKG